MMKRDDIIKQIATIVSDLEEGWTVDLKNPDVIILVDVYRNILGMSVVSREYENLRRFNLAEIYEPTPTRQDAKNGSKEPGKPETTEPVLEVKDRKDGPETVDEGPDVVGDGINTGAGEGRVASEPSIDPI